MKRVPALIILALLSAMPVLASTTLTGVVTDDMCGANHMMPGKSNAVCARACVKRGAHYALAVGDKLYILDGKPDVVDALAGAKVTVQGELNGNVLNITSIVATK